MGEEAELPIAEIEEKIKSVSSVTDGIRQQVGRAVIGQHTMVDRLLIGLLTGGHVLLEGVPGLAKTLAVRSLASVMKMDFRRIQFTPDLLPADIVGTEIYNPKDGGFSTRKGPVFTNILLADEINRAPAKVQSALLEAMAEKQVTLGDKTWELADPFLVLATQNPIEQEGTYPLPEAQADRFMMKIRVGYPTKEEERRILALATAGFPELTPVAGPQDIEDCRDAMAILRMEPVIAQYIVDVVHATRNPEEAGLDLKRFIEFGASPRATIALAKTARAHAFLEGKAYVTPDDVKAMGPDVLRHRVLLSYEAEAEGMTAEHVIEQVFQKVATP